MDENTPPPPPTPATPPPNTHPSGISESERQWGMFAHLSTFLGFLAIPFANLIAPLIMWQMKKDSMPFGSDQAKEALNFQITVMIATLISIILIVIIVGGILLIAILIFDIVVTIIAAIKANDGINYRYPLCIRLIK